MLIKKISASLLFVVLSLAAVSVRAATFPDVPDGHQYQEPIETLVNAGVIVGNPDGNFSPDRKVNRAEMLKMLYRATGKLPDSQSRACFQDVERLSWYEAYVCDAAARHYVEGYSNDGTFRPANPVNRVEALKMIMEVFGIPLEEVGEEAQQIVKFVDVSTTAWYTKYLYTAFVKGVLPIAGQDTGRFYPDWPLLRGEAAAMIFNALNVDLREQRSQQSSTPSQEGAEGATSSQASHSSSAAAATGPTAVTFPFETSGKFTEKRLQSFTFSIASNVVALTTVALQAGQPGTVNCQLYLLGENGFSLEYYLGFVEGSTCTVKAALRPGNYQFQAQPTSPNTTFTASAAATTGDGSDGFREAQTLPVNLARTNSLTPGDYQDWFMFTVDTETSMQVTVSDSTQLTCIIYPMEDVTLSSFAGPECNQHYLFPSGTYVVAVGRKSPSDARQTYTVILQ